VAETDGFLAAMVARSVESLRASNKPVFVNFTRRLVLELPGERTVVFASDDVRELFRSHGVTALKADWTTTRRGIADTLAAFRTRRRSFVRLLSGGRRVPRILPQVPTHGSLSEAFASVSKEKNAS
jgi:thiol:disulfide interchange protein DsbD